MTDLVIFDFDGVIVDSETLSNTVLAEQLTAIGCPTTLDDAYRDYMGRSWRDCLAAIEARWSIALPADFRDRCNAASAARRGDELALIDGVASFLDRLGDVPRCVASSSRREWLRDCLDRFGLSHHFGDRLFSGATDVERGKPFPDLYLHAAAAMRADPARTLVIEDSPTGVRAGVAAGMTVVGLCAGSHCRDGHADRLRVAGAHHIAHCYDDVVALLRARAA